MEESFSKLVDSASSILILLPSKPYFDQVAAGLSLYLSLSDKKPTNISCPTPMMVGFNRLVGVNKISQELGNKNLVITFSDYEASNIEKVSYDIENGQFKLTIIPKDGFTSPVKEQIQSNYSGVAADLIILVGGGNETHFPALSETGLSATKIAHIGTRALSLTGDRGIMSFAKPGSSTSELVAEMIKAEELPIDADTATNLVMGVEEGSNNFQNSDVTPNTFETFAYLLRSGGQRLPKTKLSPQGFPPGAIPAKPFGAQRVVQQTPVQQSSVLEQIEEKEEVIENPPTDWLQPKVYKGTSTPQSDSFSENKG